MPPRLNLVAIRSSDIERAVRIFEAVGLKFKKHAHGNGPEHYASENDGFVFEIYPMSPDQQAMANSRLGFEVDSVDHALHAALSHGAKLVSPAKQSPWGYRAIIADFEGNRIELVEKPTE